MRIGRTLPPAAVPIPWKNIFSATLYSFSTSADPVRKFENELKEYFGIKHCFLLSSGKAALTTILQVLHHISPEKDEVLIPAFTCFSVPAAIKKAGLKIRLCDLNMNTLDFAPENLAEIARIDKKHKKLLCAVPTHLFGIPADIEACRDVFGPDILLVEDAAQAMGCEWQGEKLGTLGDIGFFSLGRGKALSTMEGGIILTDNDEYAALFSKKISEITEYSTAKKLKLVAKAVLTNLLQRPSLFWLPKSLPFLRLGETQYQPDFGISKLSNSHCCLAKNWSATLESMKVIRKKNIEGYLEKKLTETKSLNLPWLKKIQSLIRLPIFVESHDTREQTVQIASAKGLGLMPSYPTPINEITDIKNEIENGPFVVAKRICDHIVTLPVHEYVSSCDQQNILDILSKHQSD